jgi:hypothetical protein
MRSKKDLKENFLTTYTIMVRINGDGDDDKKRCEKNAT